MYRVWRYLVAVNLSSPFITLPDVGGGEGQMSFTRAVYEVFFANKRQEVLIMGGSDGGIGNSVTNEVTKMIVEQDGTIRFEASTPMLHARYEFDAVYHQGEVISISSCSPYEFRGMVERLDTLTQTQTQLAERLPNKLYEAAAVVLNNKLLVVGGEYHDANRYCKTSDIVYELDEDASQADQGKWRALEARLNTARRSAAAVAFEGKIFVCGGLAHREELRSVESFDPATGVWQLEDNMTKERRRFSLFVHEEKLYAVGGEYGNPTIEKRNKDTKQWEQIADCGQSRSGCAAVLVDSKVFLFGGYGNESTFDFFDLRSKKWASQDIGGAYFDKPVAKSKAKPVSKRQLPRKVDRSKAVLITSHAALTKKWTDMNVVKLEDRDTARFDERFEATTGKAIAIPNPWDE